MFIFLQLLNCGMEYFTIYSPNAYSVFKGTGKNPLHWKIFQVNWFGNVINIYKKQAFVAVISCSVH